MQDEHDPFEPPEPPEPPESPHVPSHAETFEEEHGVIPGSEGMTFPADDPDEDEEDMAEQCKACVTFFARFRCNWPDECDCPKCQNLCECED